MKDWKQFPSWQGHIPQHFNIGVACTDMHLATTVEDRVAMIVEDGELGTSELTYGELATRTSRFAELLRRLNIAPGERVLIRLPNSLAYPTAFLGTLKRGGICVPTSTLLTADELEYIARDSAATALVIDKASWHLCSERLVDLKTLKHVLLTGSGDVMPATRIQTHEFEQAMESIRTWSPPHSTSHNDPAYLVYTSGTTSFPKGVLHAHRSLIGRTPAAEYWFDFDPEGDRIVHSGKFNWTYVLGTALMDPLFWGKTVIVSEGKNDARTWPRLIAKHNATIFLGVPTVFRQILQKTSYGRDDVPTLRHCMSAGEHLSNDVMAQWRSRFGIDIYEALGMTEFSYYVSQSRFHPIRPGSAGFPQPGHAIRLLNPNTLDEVAPHQEGMICVPASDPGLFLNYWNLPDETARHCRDGWFLTGDYARYDDDGYLWFMGRKDEIINSFGYRVSPYEVERVLKSHPAVADCACIGELAGAQNTIIVAYVTLQPSTTTTADELLAFGGQHLAEYKAPKKIYFIREIPRTNNGKVKRKQIGLSMAVARPGLPENQNA
jgi:acetyl-CoA synthetase